MWMGHDVRCSMTNLRGAAQSVTADSMSMRTALTRYPEAMKRAVVSFDNSNEPSFRDLSYPSLVLMLTNGLLFIPAPNFVKLSKIKSPYSNL